MSVQVKKLARARKGGRRSHHALDKTTLNVCPKCGKALKPHTACLFCGSYKGKEAVKVKTKAVKATKKATK